VRLYPKLSIRLLLSQRESSKKRKLAFNEIYELNLWNGGSGPGSKAETTEPYRRVLEEFIAQNQITSILDIGCGDFVVMANVNMNNAKYLGVDIAAEIIKENLLNYRTKDIDFIQADILHFKPRKVDLIVIKDVLQHCSNGEIQQILRGISKRSRFLIICNDTHHENFTINSEIEAGGYRPINLENEPFHLHGNRMLKWESGGFLKTVTLFKSFSYPGQRPIVNSRQE
jgi:SAM-dependent methyltransferase